MDIKIVGRNIKVTEGLRDRVNQKIGTSLDPFDYKITSVDVLLKVSQHKGAAKKETCEVTVRAKGVVIRTEASKEDLYAAIDEAARKIQRQMRKYKTKMIDRKHEQAPSIELPPLPDMPSDIPLEEDDDALVRTKYIPYDKLTEEDALVQADLLGHDFFVFTDMVSGNIHVIYHRKSGGYGILKPEEERK